MSVGSWVAGGDRLDAARRDGARASSGCSPRRRGSPARAAALLGLPLATYTAALLSNTAVPGLARGTARAAVRVRRQRRRQRGRRGAPSLTPARPTPVPARRLAVLGVVWRPPRRAWRWNGGSGPLARALRTGAHAGRDTRPRAPARSRAPRCWRRADAAQPVGRRRGGLAARRARRSSAGPCSRPASQSARDPRHTVAPAARADGRRWRLSTSSGLRWRRPSSPSARAGARASACRSCACATARAASAADVRRGRGAARDPARRPERRRHDAHALAGRGRRAGGRVSDRRGDRGAADVARVNECRAPGGRRRHRRRELRPARVPRTAGSGASTQPRRAGSAARRASTR